MTTIIAATSLSASGRRKSTRRIGGFTLLELLVAVALMGILAVLCWRGLDSVLRSRDRITAAADEIRALSTAFAQIDEDLRRSWPVRLFDMRQRPISFIPGARDIDPPLMVVLREGPALEPTMLQQVVYRVRNGVLERGFSQWQTMTFPAEVSTERLIWQPLINGVSDMAFRVWVANRGWLAGQSLIDLSAQPRPQAPPGSQLPYDGPIGVELSVLRAGQNLRRLFAVED